MKVLITDSISQRGIEILTRGGVQVEMRPHLPPQELEKIIGGYEGLIIRSGTQVTASVLAAAQRLKVIGRAGSGLDNVDVAAATKKGIAVMNTPGANTITTAEHTMALLLSLARMTPQATASLKTGKWEKGRFLGVELYRKTLGIIGLGQIGSYVAKLAQGFQMVVIASDPHLSSHHAEKMGVRLVSLDELFSRSDFITLHSPLTPETTHLINEESFSKMKDGVRIINCARGGIVSEKDLYKALLSGKVAGAALDVFEKEPVDPANPLLSLENVICTPHVGASTTEAQENVALTVAEQVVDFLVRGIVRNVVNMPPVSPELFPKIHPYLLLAEKLGSFEGQMCEGGVERVTIEYRGEVAELPTSSLTIACLKGLLNPILEENVNYVNAPIIARERGIEVREIKGAEAGVFTNTISVRIEAGGEKSSATGALFTKREPRIVEIDGVSLEVIPSGYMLVLTNIDKPGVIGGVGTLLGNNQINISRMQLGREEAGGKAISVVGIDSPVMPELLSAIGRLPNLLSVKQIKIP